MTLDEKAWQSSLPMRKSILHLTADQESVRDGTDETEANFIVNHSRTSGILRHTPSSGVGAGLRFTEINCVALAAGRMRGRFSGFEKGEEVRSREGNPMLEFQVAGHAGESDTPS
jgi:hypothetical protein